VEKKLLDFKIKGITEDCEKISELMQIATKGSK
jgi:hypothetical protein